MFNTPCRPSWQDQSEKKAHFFTSEGQGGRKVRPERAGCAPLAAASAAPLTDLDPTSARSSARAGARAFVLPRPEHVPETLSEHCPRLCPNRRSSLCPEHCPSIVPSLCPSLCPSMRPSLCPPLLPSPWVLPFSAGGIGGYSDDFACLEPETCYYSRGWARTAAPENGQET